MLQNAPKGPPLANSAYAHAFSITLQSGNNFEFAIISEHPHGMDSDL